MQWRAQYLYSASRGFAVDRGRNTRRWSPLEFVKRVPRDGRLVSAIAARHSIEHRVISAYPYEVVQKSAVLPIKSLEALGI